MEKRGVFAGVVVTSVFQALAEFSLRSTNGLPQHTMVVLSSDTNYEFATDDELEAAARQAVLGVFGEPENG